jgi:hypothetical protein
MINIQDTIIVQTPKIAKTISISILELVLNTKAIIKVLYYDDDYKIIENKILSLEQPDYGNWGSDDNFIINWVFEKLGLNPK